MPVRKQQYNLIRNSHLASSTRFNRAMPQSGHAENLLLFQQQALGNQAIQRLLYAKVIQARLNVNKPGEQYEQEAEQMADQVMRMPEPCIQRQVDPEEKEEETLQTKPLADQITPLVQRQVDSEKKEEEEKPIQAKETSGRTPEVTPTLRAKINAMRGGGQPLLKSSRDFFEPRFGYGLKQIRIHTDSKAHELAILLNARAFTHRRDIGFGPAQYAPTTCRGKKLLAHEIVHVFQQLHGPAHSSSPEISSRSSVSVQCQAIEGERFAEEGWEKEVSKTSPGKVVATRTKIPHGYWSWMVVNFAFDRAALKPGHKSDLAQLARFLSRKCEQWRFQCKVILTGHASPSGPRKRNMQLALSRATEVMGFLHNQGVNKACFGDIKREPLIPKGMERPFHPLQRAVCRSVHIKLEEPITKPPPPCLPQRDLIDKTIEAVQKLPRSNRRERVIRLLRMLWKPGVDDRYISNYDFWMCQTRRCPSPSTFGHLGKLLDLCYFWQRYGYDTELLAKRLLESEHGMVYRPFASVRRRRGVGKAVEPGIIRLYDWISKQQTNRKSIYWCYKEEWRR